MKRCREVTCLGGYISRHCYLKDIVCAQAMSGCQVRYLTSRITKCSRDVPDPEGCGGKTIHEQSGLFIDLIAIAVDAAVVVVSLHCSSAYEKLKPAASRTPHVRLSLSNGTQSHTTANDPG